MARRPAAGLRDRFWDGAEALTASKIKEWKGRKRAKGFLRQKAEGGGERAEGRGQRAEDRGKREEGRRRREGGERVDIDEGLIIGSGRF